MNLSMMRWALLGAGALVAMGVGGCATVPRSAGFADVQRNVERRSGQLIQWRGISADNAAVNRQIDALLRKTLTPESATRIALLNNRQLQATYEDLGIAQADLVQAGLLKNPTLSIERRFPGQAAEIDVAQDFLDLLVIPMRKKVAQAGFQATKMRVAHQVMQLVFDVKSAYYTFQAREQLLDRLKLVVELNRTAADLASRQHQAGTLNELDAANQRVTFEQSQADVIQTQAQLTNDRERLNRLMGVWGEQINWKIPPKLPDLPSDRASLDRLEERALAQRLDLGAQRQEIEAAAKSLGIIDTFRFVPAITVSGHYEHETEPAHSIGPAVEFGIPIFDQGNAQLAHGKAILAQAQRRYEALAIDIRSEVRQAHQRMLAHRKLAERYKTMLPERMRILQLTLEQYNGMLKGPYDLLLARQGEVVAEQKYVEAWRDYWIDRAELERALGGRIPSGGEARPQSSATASPASTHSSRATSKPSTHIHDMHMHHEQGD